MRRTIAQTITSFTTRWTSILDSMGSSLNKVPSISGEQLQTANGSPPNDKRKVLVISHLYPDEALGLPGGYAGSFIREQLRALGSLCDLRVVIPRDIVPRRGSSTRQWWNQVANLPSSFIDEGIRLDIVRYAALPPRRHFLLWYGASGLLPVWRRVREIRREFRFDVIHAHTAVPDGIIAVWLGKIFGVPVLITTHGSDVIRVQSTPWNRATLRYTLSGAAKVIAVSTDLKDRILALGIASRNVAVIPNGFAPDKFPVCANPTAHGEPTTSEKVILFLGRLTPIKNPLLLIQAVGALRRKSYRVRLIIVGDGPLREKLADDIRRLGIGESVELVGAVEHSRVAAYLRKADVLCLPSQSEGWPTVIPEALSQGIPVVASRVGGIPEVICSEDYGLLVEPGDLIALSNALERSIKISWDHEKIRNYAAKFTWRKIAKSLASEYADVVREAAVIAAQPLRLS